MDRIFGSLTALGKEEHLKRILLKYFRLERE
jgi:hypothetical protein